MHGILETPSQRSRWPAAGAATLVGAIALTAYAGGLQFDQNVTPDVIFGTGNVNGSFTIDQSSGVEVGLRAKLRFNENNNPENTFNSNGDGTYSYPAELPPTGFGFDPNSPTTPVWNFEWSVNTNWDGSTGDNLEDYTYEMQLDADPGSGTDFMTFDPIQGTNPATNAVQWDHAIGDNNTPNEGGTSIPNSADNESGYLDLLANNNVAQNSWNYEFFNDGPPLDGFDPTEPGRYEISLAVLDGSTEVARSTITLIVGTQLALSASEDWCADKDVGDMVTVDVNMSNVDTPVAGGQFLIAYDADRLTFDSAAGGDAPFDEVLFVDTDPLGTNDSSGTDHLLVAVGNQGSPDSTDADSLMAQLDFTILSEFCSQENLVQIDSGMQPIDTILTDDQGNPIAFSPMDLPAQTVDDTPPTITCPADITVNADAGVCSAVVDPGMAIAVDNCDSSPTVTASRDDGMALSDPFPAGTTTITWTASDECGNTSSCTQDVIVEDDNEAIIDLAYDGPLDTPPTDRCIEFEFTGPDGPQTVEQVVTFDANGEANNVSVLVPCGDYDCVTIRDPLHTLATSVPLNINGTVYEASATGMDSMIGGNFNQDMFVDILDFGVFVGQFGTDPGPTGGDTDCTTAAPHADITGDGNVGAGDFTFIQQNFLAVGDTGCTSPASYVGEQFAEQHPGRPIEQISVKELRRRGLGHLEVADLNNDKWLDQQDIAAFMNGARP